MDSAFELPVYISYKTPAWLIFALTFVHSGAIICVFAIPVPIWLKGFLLLTIIISYIRSVRRFMDSRKLGPPVMLILNVNNEWKLVDRQGVRNVSLLPAALVHPLILVLRFRDDEHVHSFVLTPWAVDRDVLRRLRVRLLF